VLDALQAAGVSRKVLVISAAPSVERVTAILKRGVQDVILKPYTAAALLAML
jgi:response regulator of citrate/malate metabolism